MTPTAPVIRRSIAVTATGLLSGALLATGALLPAQAAPPAPGTIQLIDVSARPGYAASGSESLDPPAISADGRYVAFNSSAADLINPHGTGSDFALYLRDTVLNTTTRIAGGGFNPVMADNGTIIAHVVYDEIFVWSAFTGENRVVNFKEGSTTEVGNRPVDAMDLSGSGNTIVYQTSSTDVLRGEAFEGESPRVYKIDAAGTTTLVGYDPMVEASDPSVSADGRYVAFSSTDAHTSIPGNGHRQIYVSDTLTGVIEAVSVDPSGITLGDGDSAHPDISADGMTVSFDSTATNLSGATTTTPSTYVYTRDRRLHSTTLTSRTAAGDPWPGEKPSMSADGQVVAYDSPDSNIIPSQISVNNRLTGTFRTASANRLPEPGNDWSWAVTMSADGRFAAWTTLATNLTADSYKPASGYQHHVLLRNLGPTGAAVRAAGVDRYETAVKVSEGAFPEGAGTVYLAAGANYPDALSGAPAAGEAGGPVLLVEKDGVPDSVEAEIERLAPERVVILGGTNSISEEVEAAVATEGRTVERLGGADRYEVSAAVAADSFGSATTVYVASGEKAPDALSGAAAAGQDSPVLLTRSDELPASVRDEIVALEPEKIVILGGTDTVGETVALELGEIADTVRVGGGDRYETSAAVADEAFGETTGGVVYISSGETFPDALTGSAAAIAADAPVLLVQKDAIPLEIGETLDRLGPSAVYVLGGADTVSDTVVEILGSYVYDIDD